MTKVSVAINDKGARIGETHQCARLTNADVDMIRELREGHNLTYRVIAEKFEVSKSLVRQICRYQIRCQTPVRWKIINMGDEE